MKRLLPLSLLLLALPALADRYVTPPNAAYREECAACHMAFPPQLLSAESWRAVMAGLPRHFGSDASLDEKRRLAITDFLVTHAGSHKTGPTLDARGRPLLRITETERFERKHRRINPEAWSRPAIKSRANCTACHTTAEQGDFSDDSVRVPR